MFRIDIVVKSGVLWIGSTHHLSNSQRINELCKKKNCTQHTKCILYTVFIKPTLFLPTHVYKEERGRSPRSPKALECHDVRKLYCLLVESIDCKSIELLTITLRLTQEVASWVILINKNVQLTTSC